MDEMTRGLLISALCVALLGGCVPAGQRQDDRNGESSQEVIYAPNTKCWGDWQGSGTIDVEPTNEPYIVGPAENHTSTRAPED